MASFLSHLKTIGEDILKGVETAAKIAIPTISTIDPPLAPILLEVQQIVAALEGSGSAISVEQLSSIIQAVSTTSAIKSQLSPAAATVTTTTVSSK